MIPALAVVGLFAFAVLVGVISAARRSTARSEAAITAWNARAERLHRGETAASRAGGGR